MKIKFKGIPRSFFLILGITVVMITLLLSACKQLSPGLGAEVDLDPPELTIDSHSNGDYVLGEFTLSGTATDDISVTEVKLTHDNSETLAILNGVNWNVSVDTRNFSDGDQEFQISVLDDGAKTTEASIYLIVDNSPPTVLVTVPDHYGEGEEFNKNFTIKGEAADTTRVKQVLLSLYYIDGTAVFTDKAATGTSSWYYTFDSESYSLNGVYYLFVAAEDFSGNRNSYFYHFDDILHSASDPGTLPNIEEINAADYQGILLETGILTDSLSGLRRTMDTDERVSVSFNPDSDKPEFIFISPGIVESPANPLEENVFASPQRLSGFVNDDDGVEFSTLEIRISNYDSDAVVLDWATIAPSDISGSQWAYSTNLPDGNYYIELGVEDIYGTSNTSTIAPFRISSFAPVVNITVPAQGSYVGNNSVFTVSASVSALGSGSVELDPTGDDDWSDALVMTDTGGGVFTLGMIGGGNFTASNGQIVFKIRAGIPGNYGTSSLQLSGDIDIPTVTVEVPSTGESVNGIINLAGTSGDNTLIRNLYLWIEEDAVPSTVPPADFTGWNIPDGTDLYNWIYNINTAALNPGVHTIHVKAVDAADNASTDFSSQFNVDQESDRPVISLSNMIIGGTGIQNGLGRDASIIGLVEDDDSVNASTLEFRIDIYDDGAYTGIDLTSDTDILDENESETWTAVSNPPSSNTRIVSWSHNLLNIPQGLHSMQVRVHDVDSDNITFDTAANPNYAIIAETRFIVDYGPPDLIITGPANGSIFSGDFFISGSASDTNGVSDVEISINGGVFSSMINPAESGNALVNWSYNFTVDAGGADDGDYSYQIQATDVSGGKTTLDRQLVVDAMAPTVVIELPGAAASVNGDSINIQGTAADNRDVEFVYLYIEEDGTPPPADFTTWDTVAGLYSWNYTQDSLGLNNTATAVDYVIYLRAVDKAGNASSEYTRMVSIDQFSDRPIIDFNDIDKNESVAANNVLVGATTLTGIIEDDDLFDPALFAGESVEINIDDTGWISVSDPPAASGKLVVWKHDISGLFEGAHTVKIRARDNLSDGTVGTASADYVTPPFDVNYNWAIEDGSGGTGIPFILNVGPPTITISEPANYTYHNSAVTISGSANDANGVDDIFISFDNGTSWTDLNVTPGASISWSHIKTVAANGDDDGTYSYLIKGVDTLGSTGVESGQFTIDATLPTVTVNQPLVSEDVNGLVTMSGIAEDNFSVEDVYIHIGATANPTPAFPGDYTLLTGTYSWTQIFDSTVETTADYTARVISVDNAGNPSALVSEVNEIDFRIDQDTDRPDISFTSIVEGNEFVQNEIPVSRLISGEVYDDDAVDTSNIQYQLYAENGTTLLIDWTQVSEPAVAKGVGFRWSHTIPADFVDAEDSDEDLDYGETITIDDGRYQMKIRVADTYDAGAFTPGGYGWNETPLVKFGIDTITPSITITAPAVNGSYTKSDFSVTGSVTDPGGISEISIQYGTDPVEVLYTDSAEPYDITVMWPADTFTVDEAGHTTDGRIDFTVTVTDAFGKTNYMDRNFFVDTRSPQAVVVSPNVDATVVNGQFVISGTAADVTANGFTGEQDLVFINISTSAVAPIYPAGYVAADGSAYNWSYTINTIAAGDGLFYAYIVPVDSAGNAGTPVSKSYQITQTSDKPVIDITSLIDAGDFTDNILPGSKQIGGTVSDDDGVAAATIQYRLFMEDGTTLITDWTDVTGQPGTDGVYTSFTNTFGGEVADGKYQVMFRAADTNDAGAWTGLYDWTESSLIKFTYDSANPTVSITAPAANGGNTNTDLTVSGTGSDAGGVKSIDIQFGSDPVINLYTGDGSSISEGFSRIFTVDDTTHTIDGQLTYTVSVTDSFDKLTSIDRYIYVDTMAPEVSIDIPGAAEIVNGTITFRGESSDTEANSYTGVQKEVWLNVDLTSATPAFPGDYILLSGVYSWDYTYVTFTNPTTFVADGNYRLSMVPVDSTGNVGIAASVDFSIDQTTDRPVLGLSSITSGETFINNVLPGSKQIAGTVTDDDNVDVSTIQYQLYAENGTTLLTAWTAISGPPASDRAFASWTHTLTQGDGKYQIQFRAADTNDSGTWISGGFGWVETPLDEISIDTSAPVVSFDDIVVDEAYSEGDETYIASAGLLINRSFRITGTAVDGNNLTSIQVSTDGSSYVNATSGVSASWYHDIPITTGGADDGTMTLYANVTDEYGKTTSINLSVIIDTIDPIIVPTQPAGIDLVDPANVNGDVTLRGTITEVSGIDTFTAVGGLLDDVPLANTGSDLSWVLGFDSTAYASSSYGTEVSEGRTDTQGNPYTATLYRFPLDVTVFDNAGNRGAEIYNIDIDPDGDRPLLYLTAPAADSSVAGAFIIQGTASDDDDITTAIIQVDLDDDGLYEDIDYDLSDGGTTAGDSDFENESVPVNIAVTNGSWNILVNQNNEFSKATLTAAGIGSPTGWIRLLVTPVDTNGVTGFPVEVRVYVDSTAPIIIGQGTALPVPANGSTVTGTVSLQARFKDDKQLLTDKMQISYDGGVSYQTISVAGGTVGSETFSGGYYEYDIDLDISTTAGGGIVPGGNGILQAVLKVTDETYKQNTMSIQLNVDNTLPTGDFNYNDDLSYIGVLPDEVYNFHGSAALGGDYLLIGSAEDTGTISGVNKVDVYFVKETVPSSGNYFFYNPTTGVTTAVATQAVADMSGTPAVIPYTTNADYLISVDNRSERGIYDTDPIDGDDDGFEESLRSKGIYDEWFVYFDTTIFPDGPMDMYTIVYDTAGNYAFEKKNVQIVNNPPSIDSVEIDGIGTLYSGLFKRTDSTYLKINASDVEGIDSNSYQATITARRTAPNGADDTTGSPAVGTVIDIADTGDGSNADDITIDVSGWESGVQYTLEIVVQDTDANVVLTEVELWVNNSDGTPPTVEMDDLTQDNLTGFTGHIEEAGFSLNDGSAVIGVISSAAGDMLSITSASLIGNGTIQAGWTAAFNTGEWRSITAFNSATGEVSLNSALTLTPSGNVSVQAGEADISGIINFTGIAFDDSVVTDVEISFNDGADWYSVDSLVHAGGDDISGHDYTWTYTLNTGNPAVNTAWTNALLNQTIRVQAKDGTNTGILTSSGGNPDKTVDIVPYITEIERTTTGLKTNRSRFGRYSVFQNESAILVNGFNLNPASAGLYADAAGAGTPDSLSIIIIDTDNYTSFQFTTGAATRSGWFGIRVDGLDAINNTNDSTQSYNSAYGTDGDDSDWTDDRYFFLFKTGEYFGPDAASSYKPQHPAMTIHPATSRLFGAWSSYATSDVFFASVNTDAAAFRSRVYHTFDTAEDIDIAMDATAPASTGRLTLAWLANNSSDGNYSYGHVSSFPYERTTGFIDGDVENDGAANLPANGVQWTRDNFSNYYYQGEGLAYDSELFQFNQVKTARYGANIHWAYHDTISDTVKYQHQLTSDNSEAERRNWINIDGTTGDDDGGEDDREAAGGIDRTTDAGEFLALTLDEDYYPVLVYYDDVGKTLRLARTGSTAPGNDETLWTRQDVFDANDPNKDLNGKHISAVVDELGFLHISFWSEDTGYLYYIKSSNNPEGGAAYEFNNYSEIVDDTSSAGIYSDLTLNKSPGTDEPYIAYLNSARLNTRDGIKIAFYDSTKNGWEYMVIANTTVVAQKRVSIEYVQGGDPGWDAAIGYASDDRFEVNYLMPEVP